MESYQNCSKLYYVIQSCTQTEGGRAQSHTSNSYTDVLLGPADLHYLC